MLERSLDISKSLGKLQEIMGLINIKVKVCNPVDGKRCREVEMLIDTGSIYSKVPASILKELGIAPTRKRRFKLANGKIMKRDIGEAVFQYSGYKVSSPVIFGKKREDSLLGVVTLETWGVEVDPVSGELKPVVLLML